MRNLNLGYTFSTFGKRNTTLRVFAAIQNLFTITNYPGLDPDTDIYDTITPEQGAILGNVPAKRTYTFGFNMIFLQAHQT